MVALPLLDAVLSTDVSPERSERVSTELIGAALGEIRHIQNLDESMALPDGDEFDAETAHVLRRMYADWAGQADALLERVSRIERGGRAIPGADRLRDAYGRTRAMLAVPLDRIQRDHHAAQQPGIALGEVRRELRSGHH